MLFLVPTNFSLASMPAILKAIAFFLIWATLWLPIAIPLAIALQWHPPQPLGPKKLPLLASLYVIVPLILWGASQIEGIPFSEFGLAWQPQIFRSFGIGLSLGVFSLAILFSIQFTLGWIEQPATDPEIGEKIHSHPPLLKSLLPTASFTLLIAVWVSITEEVIFRGFLQQELQQDYSGIIAAAIASFIFAIAHLLWEFQDTLPQLPGLWLMGMVLAWARTCDSGSLGIAIGLHAGWIWVIATLDTAQLISYKASVPEWVTGIRAKPLASASGILLLLTTAGLLAIIKGRF